MILDWADQTSAFCNLHRVNAEGKILWKATPKHALEAVWTNLCVDDHGRLHAYNFAGYDDVIDWASGQIIERTFTK
ncbi:hypothetical protein [Reyranella aquatilis]|uniref:Uncharacterized protein n=1 Tax=Reyranella aquatilis TaxID=2035356 RepID=A0ABS8KUP8_9HYPH|nr:hypothetical protein [Reyranella aquatilis]MCC8429477.1 hypothetical protein [Reyranella aquatilis]